MMRYLANLKYKMQLIAFSWVSSFLPQTIQYYGDNLFFVFFEGML